MVVNHSLKYKTLTDILRARIENLPAGSRLPSLRALKQKTGFSIQTINKAISLLDQEGVLIRKHGSGLYVSSDKGNPHIAFCRSAFPSITSLIKEDGIVQACTRRGWSLSIHQFRQDMPYLLDHEVRGSGVVVFPEIFNFGYGIAKILLSSKTPIVSLGGNAKSPDIDCVTGDHLAAMSLVLNKLVSLGHRRIAYLNTEPACDEINERLEFFTSLTGVLDLGKCPIIECHTQAGQNSDNQATRAINEFLTTHRKRLPFTAIISCSSPGSVVAMRILHEHGWRIPQDCSVICMQEDPIAPYTIPALTNLKWDYPQWGEHCVTLIEKRLHGNESSGQQSVKIVPEFNWRESVDKAPAS